MPRTIFTLSLSFLLFLLSGCTFQSHVIDVTLVNKGPAEARNIEFRYPGGSFGVSSLAPGGTYEYRIKPFFKGPIEVEYLYGGSSVRSTISEVQKEQSGKVTVVIEAKGATWEAFKPSH